MSRSAKPQNGRRRFLRDVVRTAGGLAAVGVALGLQQQTARASGVRLRPPSHKRERLCQCLCALRSVYSGLPLRHLKTGDPASGLSAGTPYFVARDIPCEMCEDIPCAKVCPSGALDREIESIDDARMGLAVLVDRKTVSTFRGCAAMFVIANARKLMRPSPRSWSATREPVSTPAFCRRFTATPVPAAVSAKSVRAGTTGNQGVTAVTGERGVRSPLPLRLAGEQWQIVNVTPGARRWRKRLVAQSPLVSVTSPLSVLRAGDVLSGPWFGVWILHGNYSSSLLFDTVPLTDPLMTLQSLASGHLPATVALTGAVIITVLYARQESDYFAAGSVR